MIQLKVPKISDNFFTLLQDKDISDFTVNVNNI